jgi:hypothetical protein
MRHFSFKALMVLLMSAVLATPLATPGLQISASSKDRPAGCHEHGPRVPAPVPISHQCCQNTHDAAMLMPSSTPGPSQEVSALIQFSQGAVVPVAFDNLPNLAIVSGDPPNLSPLRV